jgi:hypothetical protein
MPHHVKVTGSWPTKEAPKTATSSLQLAGSSDHEVSPELLPKEFLPNNLHRYYNHTSNIDDSSDPENVKPNTMKTGLKFVRALR